MAVTAYWFGRSLVNAFGGSASGDSYKFDWLSDTIKVALLTSSYTVDQNDHMFWSQASSAEVTGTNYSAGGATLANPTLTFTSGTPDVIKFDGDDVTWASSTITARFAIIYDDTQTGKPMLGYVNFGQDYSSSNGNFTIQWATEGIFTINVTSP